MVVLIHSGYLPGSIGRVVELHARYYAGLVGFGLPFEARVARELADFCGNFDASRDGLWLALHEGAVEGAIAIDGAHARTRGAHLRWFIASDRVRGTGTGTRLLGEAMAFCDACGYTRRFLWTIDGLAAARHLYEKFGFRLAVEQRGSHWGADMLEQRFEAGD